MSAIETPDYQRSAVRPQQKVATVAGGTATVAVTLPANADTLAVYTPGGAPAGTLSVTGVTSNIAYPGRAVATDAAITASPSWFFQVSNVFDAIVNVTFTSAPGASWYVIAGPATTVLPIAGGAGGGGTSPFKFHKLPFAYNTPGISTTGSAGANIFTPTSGDHLIDAWIEINTPWNGTTPNGDIGFNGASGMFGFPFDPTEGLLMSNSDLSYPGQSGGQSLTGNNLNRLSLISAIYNLTLGVIAVSGTTLVPGTTPLHNGVGLVPMKMTTTNPIKIWVTTNGATTGTNPGSTQGTGILYLITGTSS